MWVSKTGKSSLAGTWAVRKAVAKNRLARSSMCLAVRPALREGQDAVDGCADAEHEDDDSTADQRGLPAQNGEDAQYGDDDGVHGQRQIPGEEAEADEDQAQDDCQHHRHEDAADGL